MQQSWQHDVLACVLPERRRLPLPVRPPAMPFEGCTLGIEEFQLCVRNNYQSALLVVQQHSCQQ